jgi:hypothetical protein
VNQEIKRSTDVVGPISNHYTLPSPAEAVLAEQDGKWEASERRYFSNSLMLELKTMNDVQASVGEVNLIVELTAAEPKDIDLRGNA